MKELKTQTESGTKITLKLDEDNREILISAEGLFEDETCKEMEHKGQKVLNAGIMKIDGKRTRMLTPINNEMRKWLGKAYYKIEELEEKERQRELVFEVQEADLGPGAWNATTPVLVNEDKLMTDEQREKKRELENILGTTALFAGGPKYISAKELPVEEGKEYTLDNIIELAEEHSEKWQKAKKKEQAEKKKIEEAKKEARETGKNVKINRYTAHCNDPNEECSTDIITVYMTPSGRKKEERTHTY